jgi:hypothetical protein
MTEFTIQNLFYCVRLDYKKIVTFKNKIIRGDQEGLFKLVTLDRILNRITGVTSGCWWLVVINDIPTYIRYLSNKLIKHIQLQSYK